MGQASTWWNVSSTSSGASEDTMSGEGMLGGLESCHKAKKILRQYESKVIHRARLAQDITWFMLTRFMLITCPC